ncbi:MAG TPA: hypothetical protein VF920_05875 [Dongiaceae bacterium]
MTVLKLIGDTFAKQFVLTGQIKNSILAVLFVVAGNLCRQSMLRKAYRSALVMFSLVPALRSAR